MIDVSGLTLHVLTLSMNLLHFINFVVSYVGLLPFWYEVIRGYRDSSYGGHLVSQGRDWRSNFTSAACFVDLFLMPIPFRSHHLSPSSINIKPITIINVKKYSINIVICTKCIEPCPSSVVKKMLATKKKPVENLIFDKRTRNLDNLDLDKSRQSKSRQI